MAADLQAGCRARRPQGKRLPDVDEDEDRGSAVPGVAALLHPEDLHEPPTVGQAGQLVDHRTSPRRTVVVARSALHHALAHLVIVPDRGLQPARLRSKALDRSHLGDSAGATFINCGDSTCRRRSYRGVMSEPLPINPPAAEWLELLLSYLWERRGTDLHLTAGSAPWSASTASCTPSPTSLSSAGRHRGHRRRPPRRGRPGDLRQTGRRRLRLRFRPPRPRAGQRLQPAGFDHASPCG